MICKNGLHELDPHDQWRAPNGARCRACWETAQERYEGTWKASERHCRYDRTAKGIRRRLRWAERYGHETYLIEGKLAEAERYEARPPEEAHLLKHEWLNIHEPLPVLRIPKNLRVPVGR